MEKNCKFKCDNFETGSLTGMVEYILSQCSVHDFIKTWYYLTPTQPCLSVEVHDEDTILGNFCLGELLFMYDNDILSREIGDTAFLSADDYLIDELHRAYNRHEEMINTTIGENDFHIDLIWED